jgi:hypothetical protein
MRSLSARDDKAANPMQEKGLEEHFIGSTKRGRYNPAWIVR